MRQREKECMFVHAHALVCVCACTRERERVCVFLRMHVFLRVCVCVLFSVLPAGLHNQRLEPCTYKARKREIEREARRKGGMEGGREGRQTNKHKGSSFRVDPHVISFDRGDGFLEEKKRIYEPHHSLSVQVQNTGQIVSLLKKAVKRCDWSAPIPCVFHQTRRFGGPLPWPQVPCNFMSDLIGW